MREKSTGRGCLRAILVVTGVMAVFILIGSLVDSRRPPEPVRATPRFAEPEFDHDLLESDAIVSGSIGAGQLEGTVSMIRASGYRCDSVSAIRPLVMSPGFSVACNRHRYDYLVRDRGGSWIVELD